MDIRIPIEKLETLKHTPYKSIQVTYSGSLDKLTTELPPLVKQLSDKQLTQCYLIPFCQSSTNSLCTQQNVGKIEQAEQGKYDAVLLGGTFDYLHIGHQILLLTAISSAKKRILVGVTGQQLLKKKKNRQVMQQIQIRKKKVEQYIKKVKPSLIIQIQEINDMYGPAIVRDDFDAIAVSYQTRSGADKINSVRKQKNMKQLQVIVCPLIMQPKQVNEKQSGKQVDKQSQLKISSSTIRQQILNKNEFSIEQFIEYKQKWFDLINRLQKYLSIQQHSQQLQHRVRAYGQEWWNTVLIKYSQYWRYYHTNNHICYMLNKYQDNQMVDIPQQVQKDQLQVLTLLLGIWFHDVQYNPSSKNNEQLSADIAIQFIQGFLQLYPQQCAQEVKLKLNRLAQKVKQAIIATKHHKTQEKTTKILIDLDMLILDSPPNQYQTYSQKIKQQYLPIVKQAYNTKRIQFLHTLNPSQVFYFHKPSRIQHNIEWQIEQLSKKQKSQNQQL